MPYIDPKARGPLIEKVIDLTRSRELSKGEYNFIITRILHTYIERKGLSYEHLNDVVGIIECVKQEFVRTVANPYEDRKIKQNGHISDVDKRGNLK